MTSASSIITVTLNPTIDRVLEVPGLRPGDHVQGRLLSLTPAGKAFNVSRTLAALGVSNTAMGFVGRDAAELFASAAQAAGVIPRFTPIAGTTRQNITLVDPTTHMSTHVREAGPTVPNEEVERLGSQLAAESRPEALIIFSGSLPPGMSPEGFGRMLDACLAGGARVAVDTSREPLREAVRRPLWLIKPNRAELAELAERTPRNLDELAEAGRRLNERIQVVLITLGEDGALGLSREYCGHARTIVPTGRMLSTVGCGDAFMAAFIAAAVTEGQSMAEALRHAVAVAAASAMTDLPAAFKPSDLEVFRPRVVLTNLRDDRCA